LEKYKITRISRQAREAKESALNIVILLVFPKAKHLSVVFEIKVCKKMFHRERYIAIILAEKSRGNL